MAEIPKIVGQRLQAMAKATDHPDPNLLAAFTERSLGKRERVQVLEHLAQCPDCRDIVSLAVPEFAAGGAVSVAPARSGWLSWPVLRWGAAAACVVVVGAAVTLHYQGRQSSRPLTAALQMDQPSAAGQLASEASSAAKAPTANLAAQSTSSNENKKAAPPKQLQPPNPQAAARSAPPGTTQFFGVKPSASGSRMSGAGTPSLMAKTANPVREDEPKQTVEVTGATPVIDSEKADAVGSAETAEVVPGRAKDALQESDKKSANGGIGGDMALAKRPMAPAAVAGATQLRAKASFVPRWTLTSDGTLQRSFDSGRTWEAISVSNNTTFRALAANGLDIWVGGTAGALYHSSDAGQRWSQVQPLANGERLTADIIGVEFPDALHGKLTTSNQETWTTEDAGQSWQRK